MQSIANDNAATLIQAYVRGACTRRYLIPRMKETYCSNTETVNLLLKQIADLKKVCAEQQYIIAMQGDKIHVLDQIFRARQKKNEPIIYNNDVEVCGFETYPLPRIGDPEE